MAKGMGLKPFDVVLILSFLACAGVLWITGTISSGESSSVFIHSEKGLYRQARLDEDVRITVQGPLGKSIVQIRSGEASVIWSSCPDKSCVHMGRISRPGEGILCIPNRVFVTIGPTGAAADAVTY